MFLIYEGMSYSSYISFVLKPLKLCGSARGAKYANAHVRNQPMCIARVRSVFRSTRKIFGEVIMTRKNPAAADLLARRELESSSICHQV